MSDHICGVDAGATNVVFDSIELHRPHPDIVLGEIADGVRMRWEFMINKEIIPLERKHFKYLQLFRER